MTNSKNQISNQIQIIKFLKLLVFGFLILFVIWILAFGFFNKSFAQTAPQFLISWRAINYVPSDYAGKILPSKSSPIEIGFDLIDGNKIADLSKNQIRWALDNVTIAEGKGLKTAKFNVLKAGGNNHIIRIIVADYKGQELEEIVTIPIASPEVAISAKTPDNRLSLGKHTLKALPYFFNINNLNNLAFNWSINNQPIAGQAGNPDFLNLNLESEEQPRETDLNAAIVVQNLYNQLEMAVKKLNLIIR